MNIKEIEKRKLIFENREIFKKIEGQIKGCMPFLNDIRHGSEKLLIGEFSNEIFHKLISRLFNNSKEKCIKHLNA